ncbi:MAG: VCBS repeat-containing protein [Theionarchaea archaeon]|nr:VCBS repeat-containing protein [Theionarchaea archaeon]MBU7001426.1 VCBS repeat-containing protein [Theionarchaea archaeon]MBU7034339.1 VCBS repeat-containing protein [Theionarchaea archaeon]MBU7040304.1 VCBS repeat-containing protein [Theionarchaea archaeon]
MRRALVLALIGFLLFFSYPALSWYGPFIGFGSGNDATHDMALGDVDKDGIADLVTGNYGTQNYVYYGNGDGTFTTTHAFGTGTDLTQEVLLCDVNNDTWLDIVVGNNQQQNYIYLNDTDGTFDTTSYPFGTGSDNTYGIAYGLINGDAWPDLVVGNLGQQNYAYLSDGVGNPFDSIAPIPFGQGEPFYSRTWDVVLADMNNDSDLDVVVANHQQYNFVYLGDGTGSFNTAYGFGSQEEFTHSLAVDYINGDGFLDIVEGNYDGQNRVYLGNGTGSMGTSYSFGPVDDRTQVVTLSDIDGDTYLDVLIGNGGDTPFQNRIFMGNGDGTFSAFYNVGSPDITWDAVFEDFNGDALTDIAVVNVGQNKIFLNSETTMDNLASIFDVNTFFVAGDTAYCTDVLGSSKIAFGLGRGGASQNPEGRTDLILTPTEHDTGNLIIVGGPAVNPVATEFDSYFGITYTFVENVSFEIQCEGYAIFLDIAHDYPQEDICIVYVGEHDGRNIMLVWGYGWFGTYAGSAYIGEISNWSVEQGYHMLMIRWNDINTDGLIQSGEIAVQHRN